MIKLSQAFIGFMMIHLYVTLFSEAAEETTRYCSPSGTVASSCCGKWCSKKWSQNRGSHTQKAVCFGRIRAKTRRDKDIYKTSSCKDVTSAPVDVLAQKVLESSSLFGTHLFVGSLLQHVGETVRKHPHYILFSLPSCTPFCPVATSPESDWPSGRGWNLATLTNSLPWLKPLKNIIDGDLTLHTICWIQSFLVGCT